MTLAELRASVGRVLGVDMPLESPTRLSRFTFQARQAESYRVGRILLAGDAAHLFPATGVALNAGMLDTVNLAWKLAASVQGWAPEALLGTYHSERHYAGVRTLLHTQAQVALRRAQDPAADALRAVFQELLSDEQALERMGAFIAGSDIRYPMPGDHELIGGFAPDLTLHTDDAHRRRHQRCRRVDAGSPARIPRSGRSSGAARSRSGMGPPHRNPKRQNR